ncbi:MAG: alpha-glucosidase/alpha-galactosidase [Chloroflexota bacterium]|nr:alpha-glucosidase/alpha-galactosidase [Chloroflexota bacterium]
MPQTKIILIGAGSTIFGVNTLADLFAQRAYLRGSHLALCDVDGARLARVTHFAERMNVATDANFKITSVTDYRDALPGAEFVIVSVEVDRIARWKLDWEIPFKYGIKHVLGENGGPGGLSHALRTIDLVLGIAREVERLAPDAYLLNFTNPLPRVMLAVTRYTRLKAIGLCHQVNKGYYIVGHVLGLTPHLDAHFPPPQVARELKEKIDLQTAGLNHITWIQEIYERATGQDLYPAFRARLLNFDPTFEPLSRRLHKAFGLFPATGDDHVGEYFSFAHETSDLKGYTFDQYAATGAALDARVDRAITDSDALKEFLNWESAERAASIVAGIVNDWHSYEVTVNVVNNVADPATFAGAALPGLPDWAIVEVPGVVSASGVTPLRVPALPPAITAVLNREAAIQDRVVEAAVHGDRHAALQALLLDPLIPSYADAEKMLDEFLTVHADALPQFNDPSV